MLAFLSVVAAIQLAAACRYFPSKREKSAAGFFACIFLGLLVSFLLAMLTLFFQCLALLVIGLACMARRAKTRHFFAAGAITSAAIFLAIGLHSVLECSNLKQRYPVVSLTDRLAYELDRAAPREEKSLNTHGAIAHETPAEVVTPAAIAQLDQMYEDYCIVRRLQSRSRALAYIHESQVTQFVESPGFGIGRMIPRDPSAVLRDLQPEPESVPYESSAAPESRSAAGFLQPGGPAPPPVPGPSAAELEFLHDEAQVDFANVSNWGYVKSREYVAGFEPHGFRSIPNQFCAGGGGREQELCKSWVTRRVELVSLLKHPEPMVYLSDHLPRMDELRNARVRPLDAFERESLPALRAGANIRTRDAGGRIRMLGAIRAAKQCLDCHAAKHGALLGAFSYDSSLASELIQVRRTPSRARQSAATKY